MQKKQVLLCGTLYGQVYLPAIFQSPDLELAGILANGSDRSVRLAEQNGVDLFSDPKQLSQPMDIACVAINQSIATPLAMKLMELGCDILIEHPVGATNIARLLDTAENQARFCHINSHFADLPSCEEFIVACRKHNLQHPLHVIQVQCNSRTLFSCLDILMRCFGCFELKCLNIQSAGHYRHCSFLLNNTALSLTYQHWRHAIDDSTDSPLGHQISLTFPHGVLSLPSSLGPCLWYPLVKPGAPISMPIIQSNPQNTFAHTNVAALIQWRKQANQKALGKLLARRGANTQGSHFEHELDATDAAYTRHLCQLWSRLSEKLGFAICSLGEPA